MLHGRVPQLRRIEQDFLAFDEREFHRVLLTVCEDNSRAIQACEKRGSCQEGRLREAIFRKGRCYDMLLMSILRSGSRSQREDGADT